MKPTFKWIQSPADFNVLLEQHEKRSIAALHAICVRWGLGCQTRARQHGPWEDRTGAARQGLFFAVDADGFAPVEGEVSAQALNQMTDYAVERAAAGEIAVFLSHSVYYGVYLEEAHGGEYAIIFYVLEDELPALRAALERFAGRR